MRDEDVIANEVMRRIQNDLDLEQTLLESPEIAQACPDESVEIGEAGAGSGAL